MVRGYFGIGLILPKNEMNVGTLLRSAHAFGAGFCFTIGRRYRRQPSDTLNTTQHIPFYHYETADDFFNRIPVGCAPVVIEVDGRHELPAYSHLPRAVYILGPEDGSVPPSVQDRAAHSVRIPTKLCLNVATAGSIVMYDRIAKQSQDRVSR